MAKSIKSVLIGYHAYMDVWSPLVGDEFPLQINELNIHDRRAIVTEVACCVVGYIPN